MPPIPQKTGETEEEEDREDFERAMYQLERLRVEDLERQLRELNEKFLVVTNKEIKRHSENENLKMELIKARDRIEFTEIALKRRENELEETKRLVNSLRDENRNSFEEKFQLRELNEKLLEVTEKETKRHSENENLKMELFVARDRTEIAEIALKRRENELEETKRLVNLLREEKCNSFEEKFQLRLEKEDLEERLAMAESSKDDLQRKLRALQAEVNDLKAVLRSQSPELLTGSRNKEESGRGLKSSEEISSSGPCEDKSAKEQKPYLKLRNERNNCFMNSVLSCIADHPVSAEIGKLEQNEVSREFLNLIKQEGPASSVGLRDLIGSKMNGAMNDGRQHDCAEFYRSLVQLLPKSQQALFTMKRKLVNTCAQCKKVLTETEEDVIAATIPQQENDCYNMPMTLESLNHEERRSICEQCKMTSEKAVVTYTKDEARILAFEMPMAIHRARQAEKRNSMFTDFKTLKFAGAQWELCGAVQHVNYSDSIDYGHYVAWVKENDDWYCINDLTQTRTLKKLPLYLRGMRLVFYKSLEPNRT